MLTYSSSPLAESFSDLLEADIDDDAQLFYLGMASDIAVVAAGAERASLPARKLLLAALIAPQPDDGTSSWREFYREVSTLVAAYPATASAGAAGRLRRFLAENADFADALAIEELERTMLGHVLGA